MVREIVLEAIQTVPGFVHEPEPLIVFNSLTDNALELNVNFWVDVSKTDPLRAKDAVLLKVHSAFMNKIEIPHPVWASTQVQK
jgi:small-conductance mechanosensitive channel